MTPKEYIENAIKTEKRDNTPVIERVQNNSAIRYLHAAMGLQTESAEITDALKKHIFYGKELDLVNIKEELGDLFWYCAILCDELGTSFEEVMQTNINKLKSRYGDKFTEEKALHRDLDAERAVLEK